MVRLTRINIPLHYNNKTRLIMRGSRGFPMKEKEEVFVSEPNELNALSYPKKRGDNLDLL
ncbi:MAG: hypothetical protein ABII89_00785 [Candidatus Omnitrophota bacterium]